MKYLFILFLLLFGCANTNTWPKGIIPIYFEHPGISKEVINRIIIATQIWMIVTDGKIRFQYKDHPASEKEPNIVTFISIDNTKIECGNGYGYREGESKWIILSSTANNLTSTLHELGHVIGLIHEHQRPDRDKHITVLWDNIINMVDFVGLNQFSTKIPNTYNYELYKYDYHSIMHYKNFIDGAPREAQFALFDRNDKSNFWFGGDFPSPTDIKKVKDMYSNIDLRD